MERGAWTNERLDDLVEGMRSGFARVDQDIRDLRTEMSAGFQELRAETNAGFQELRAETNAGFQGLRAETNAGVDQARGETSDLRTEMHEEFRALHTRLYWIGGGIIFALIGVIAAILTRGV